MRKLVAALQVSVDGFIEGPNGELDWAMAEDEETWKDIFDMLKHVDTFILGRVMGPFFRAEVCAANEETNRANSDGNDCRAHSL
jgi:dihydrofolate reductase